MINQFFPRNLKRIVVYLHPINMRWGTTKLRSLCRDELGMEPNASTAFLFTNKSQDCLLLFSIDADGDRTVAKKLERGAFVVPAPVVDGSPFVILRPSILQRLFKS